MNIFFKINGTVVTPKLNGSILPGITRRSAIELCEKWGVPVEERRISVEEIVEAGIRYVKEKKIPAGQWVIGCGWNHYFSRSPAF